MPCCPPPLLGVGPRLRSFLRDYDALQSLALALIYLQIVCALIGSLGALFNGVLVINLVIGLFAVVAIESSSQRLGRAYAVLLFFAVVLDVAWFILFSHAIWTITPDEKYGQLFVFSLRLALWMQIIGFSVRFLSSFLWIQMYRVPWQMIYWEVQSMILLTTRHCSRMFETMHAIIRCRVINKVVVMTVVQHLRASLHDLNLLLVDLFWLMIWKVD
ncbi:uncharacterized protein [Miscanthus floridulus]|uniref:uncharacterized protein isoform X2 n=1 Tax=Miscanthus floridulus TaxID=154761 RepID=UPI0034597CB6